MNSKIYFNPTWATTRQGLNIPLWSSHSPERELLPKNNNFILFIGGVHGDEPEGVWLAESLLNWIRSRALRRQHGSKASVKTTVPLKARAVGQNVGPTVSQSNGPAKDPATTLGTTSAKTQTTGQSSSPGGPSKLLEPAAGWALIPCLNPEGYHRLQRTNSAGVDLNRNFPSPDWSPQCEAPRYFPGPQPGSEPEVQGVIRAIELYKPNLIIHFHSWKPCVVYTGAPGEPVARILGEHSGYPHREDIGYPTPGSLGQYGWLTHQIPVICVEEQEGCPRENIWPRFQWALTDLLR
jgi:hypothetical protein